MSEKVKYMMGEIGEMTQSFDVQTTDGNVIKISKGDMAIVGFDGYLHHLNHNLVEKIDSDKVEVEGFSAAGLSEYITTCIEHNIDLASMLSNYGIEVNKFIYIVRESLARIGFYNGEKEGN